MSEPFRTPADAQADYGAQIKIWAKQSSREEIERARQMTGEEKVRSSLELFEFARNLITAGIRNQFPAADEEEVCEIRRQRFDIVRRLEAKQQ